MSFTTVFRSTEVCRPVFVLPSQGFAICQSPVILRSMPRVKIISEARNWVVFEWITDTKPNLLALYPYTQVERK